MAWSDTLLSGVGLDATRFSGSFSGRPEGSEVATAVLTLAACAGLLRAFDRLPHLKPWRRGNPPLSSAAELRSRMAPPRVATPAESLVLPTTCAIVPGTAATPTALDMLAPRPLPRLPVDDTRVESGSKERVTTTKRRRKQNSTRENDSSKGSDKQKHTTKRHANN